MGFGNAFYFHLLRRAWAETMSCLKRPRALGPFVAYAILQFLMLIGFTNLHDFPFSRIFLPLQVKLFGERAVHYPNNLVVLPNAMDIVNLALSGLVGIVVLGVATRIFYSFMGGKEASGDIRPVLSRYGHLFAVWLIEMAIILGILYGAAKIQPLYPNFGHLLTTLRIAAVLLIMSVFAYTVAVIVLEQASFLNAIAASIRIFAHWWGLTLLIITIPTLARLPLDLFLNDSAKIVENMTPEIIPVLVGSEIVVSLFVNFIIIGTITYVYRSWAMTESALGH